MPLLSGGKHLDIITQISTPGLIEGKLFKQFSQARISTRQKMNPEPVELKLAIEKLQQQMLKIKLEREEQTNDVLIRVIIHLLVILIAVIILYWNPGKG